MKKIVALILLAALTAIPAAAVTPSLRLDTVKFASTDVTASDFVDNQPASGNKTRIKGVKWTIENRDWGYLKISWKGKSAAKAYQVETSSNANFSPRVYRAKVYTTSTTKKLGAFDLRSGAVEYLRVRALYKNDKAGKWSKAVIVSRNNGKENAE